MEIFMYVCLTTLSLILDVVQLGMLLRVIFQIFDPGQSSRFSAFLLLVTEPVILPIRALCAKMNWFQKTPIDIPFLITVLLLSLLQALLSMV